MTTNVGKLPCRSLARQTSLALPGASTRPLSYAAVRRAARPVAAAAKAVAAAQ